MDVRHDDHDLGQLEANLEYSGSAHSQAVIRAFRKTMNLIRQVRNETELYQWKGLRLEKLEGNRSHQHSMRLNNQWRLIVEFESRPGPNNSLCAIKGIEDYH